MRMASALGGGYSRRMKTERIVLRTTPEFKAFLTRTAQQEGVSIAELVQSRCGPEASAEEAELARLLPELRHSLEAARESVRRNLDSVAANLRAMRAARSEGAT